MEKSAAEGSSGNNRPATPIATYSPQETNRGTGESTLPYVAIKGADRDAARPHDSNNPHAVPRCSVLNTIGVYLPGIRPHIKPKSNHA
ncbi:hypothetical protein TMatcc_004790 [Talaromyces marneffei ATCC 18224]